MLWFSRILVSLCAIIAFLLPPGWCCGGPGSCCTAAPKQANSPASPKPCCSCCSADQTNFEATVNHGQGSLPATGQHPSSPNRTCCCSIERSVPRNLESRIGDWEGFAKCCLARPKDLAVETSGRVLVVPVAIPFSIHPHVLHCVWLC